MDRNETLAKLDRFFSDPDWPLVESMLMEYVEPLRYASSVDLKQDSHAVHAEIKANLAAYAAITGFLSDIGALRNRKREPVSFK